MTDRPHVDQVFLAVLERPTAAERSRFLDEACRGQPELRKRVEQLLAAAEKMGSFLERPAADRDTTEFRTPQAEPASELIGQTIGPYKILEQIGEGGMGVVYMADQLAPLRRRVALKIIKPGMDSGQVIARFEAERQALAMMEHPNIARVFDAGTSPSGRPYFAMELVRGVPITDYCDQNQLSVRERLELFVQVCRAVQHAHQKGIIHRDLKPANVLVTLSDGRPVPKVIDFGVAKALNQQLTERTLFTNFAQFIGTPIYMSPEQAEMTTLDVDTRADVYSLGVLLYELLTGTTPFDQQRLGSVAYDEIRRIIREEEPERPSTRISTLSEQRTSIASHRKIDSEQLSQLMREELDWIVLKSLEKDRTRRYTTADGFALDVERYLSGEPVEACPPSTWYRFRKFARKHRVVLSTASLVLAALTAGIMASTWQAVRAARAESAADTARQGESTLRQQEQQARVVAETARGEAESQRQLATSRNQQIEHMLYASQIGRAQSAWEDINLAGAWTSLNSCPQQLRGWEHDYLYTLFTRGYSSINCSQTNLRFSADRNQFVAVDLNDNNNPLKVWDTATGRALLTLEKGDAYSDAEFTPDGQMLVGSVSDWVVVWDANTGLRLHTFESSGGAWVTCSRDGRFFGGIMYSGDVKLWSLPDCKPLLHFPNKMEYEYADEVTLCVRISANGQYLACCGDDRLIRLWDLSAKTQLPSLDSRAPHVRFFDFSPDSQRLVTVTDNHAIQLWAVKSGEELSSLQISRWPEEVVFSPDGARLAESHNDGSIVLRDSESLAELRRLRPTADEHAPRALTFSLDGLQLLCASDRRVIAWDAVNGQEPLHIPNRPAVNWDVGASSVAVTPDGKRIVTDSGVDTLMTWDAISGEKLMTLSGHTDRTACLAISADGRHIASGSHDDTVRQWDAETGRELSVLQCNGGGVKHVCYSPDNKLIGAVLADRTLKLWDAESGKLLHQDKQPAISNLVFSLDSEKITVAYETLRPGGASTHKEQYDYSIHIIDLTSYKIIRTLTIPSYVHALALSPDGTRLATADNQSIVHVLDFDTGKELRNFRGHFEPVATLAFSPDGRTLASGSRDCTVKLWSLESDQELLTLRGHKTDVLSLAFSPDGRRLVSAAGYEPLIVWDASRRAPVSAPAE